MRSDFQIKTFYQLFPNFYTPQTAALGSGTYNPEQIVSKVELPDGRSYKLLYTSYNELARIELPTGGAIEYEFPLVGFPAFIPGKQDSASGLFRHIVERTVYATGGSKANNTPYDSKQKYFRSSNGIFPDYKTNVTVETFQGNANGQTEKLEGRTVHYFYGAANSIVHDFYSSWREGREYKTEVFDASEQLKQRTLTEFEQPFQISWANSAWNNKVVGKLTRVKNVSSTVFEDGLSLTSKTVSGYEPNNPIVNNQTDSWVYDFGTNGAPGRLLKHSQTSFLKVNPVNGQDYTAPNIWLLGIPATSKLFDVKPDNSEVLISQSETRYDESAYPIISAGTATHWTDPNTNIRGNATTARVWDSTTDSWIESHAQFDNFGNARKAWDAKGNSSEVEFAAAYNYAYPTKTISVVPDPSGQRGSNVPFESTTVYDFYTGLVLSTTDANGQTSSVEYNDVLLRPTKVIPPSGGAQTITEYGDTPGNLFVRSKTQIDATNWSESTAYFDGLGRTFKTQKKDTQGDVFTETIYDNLGRVKQVTNPFRIGETKQWSTSNYDAVGRVKEVIAPDGTKVESDYGISTVPNFVGTFVVGTDQAGKSGRSITNALGQLVRVDEPDDNGNLGTLASPTQPTFYNYSPQGQMVKVTQGVQNRFFLYDGLGRLIRVRQPEQDVNANLNLNDAITGNNQWTAGFTYDISGNLITATDAKGVTITSAYDNANRVLTRTYSDGTSPANYFYDSPSIQFSKGHLTQATNAISTSQVLAFDNFGRVTNSRQLTDGNNFDSSYIFNMAGGVIEETYPSGRKIRNTFEADGDLSKIETQKPNQAWEIRIQNVSYSSTGAVQNLQLGNGLWENAQFNNRYQITQLGLGTSPTDTSLWRLNYDFGELDANGNFNPAKNNGNLARQSVTSPVGMFTQNYRYDSLDRVTHAYEMSGGNQTWNQNFSYDRYGNRIGLTQTINGQPSSGSPTVDINTNRFTAGQGYVYDINGNLIQDAQGRQYTFNGDNKQIEVKNSQNQIIGQYFYDADGKRIKKITNDEITVFVYAGGKLVAEYSSSTATPTAPSTQYLAADLLGSVRAISNQTGQVTSRRDFMPFGEDLPRANYGIDNARQKFTGFQRDNETGLDFAEARYYNNGHGRFTAVDPLLASGKSANPQTFNRYVYTSNNPLTRVDKTGLDWWRELNPETGKYRPVWHDGSEAPYVGAVRWASVREDVYKANDGSFYALNPTANESRKFAEYDRAYWQYGIYTDFKGGYDGLFDGDVSAAGVLKDLIGVKDFAYLVAYMKVGDFDNAALMFTKIAAINGIGAGVGKFAVPLIKSALGRVVGSEAVQTLLGKVASKVPCCFVAGTLIHTKNGLVAIEKIKVGDKVLSYNEKTKKLEYKAVASVMTAIKTNIVKLKIQGEKRVFTTTTEHPFYVQKTSDGLSNDKVEGEWKTAEFLKVGDKVLSKNGKWKPILEISRDDKPTKVYNFEVEDNHSYFVGNEGVLSHNCETVSAIISGLSKNLCQFGKCVDFANAAKNALVKNGVSGEIIEVSSKNINDTIISSTVKSAKGFDAEVGDQLHQGVRVGNIVYDNLNPQGVAYDIWINSFSARSGMNTPKVTPF